MKSPTKGKRNPAATRVRVAVMEALERHGGSLRSRHGLASRLVTIHADVLGSSTNISALLRGMQDEGLVCLNEVAGANGGKKITEAILVTVPPNFLVPIAQLRARKGIDFHPTRPESSDDPAEVAQEPEVKVWMPEEEALRTEGASITPHPSAPVPDETTLLEQRLIDQGYTIDAQRNRIRELERQLSDANATIRYMMRDVLEKAAERDRSRDSTQGYH